MLGFAATGVHIIPLRIFRHGNVKYIVLCCKSADSVLAFVHMISHSLIYCSVIKEINYLSSWYFCLFPLPQVMPVNGSDWSEEAVGWFHAMVHNRTLYARLYPQGPKVTVELFLEKGRLGAMRYLSMKHKQTLKLYILN